MAIGREKPRKTVGEIIKFLMAIPMTWVLSGAISLLMYVAHCTCMGKRLLLSISALLIDGCIKFYL